MRVEGTTRLCDEGFLCFLPSTNDIVAALKAYSAIVTRVWVQEVRLTFSHTHVCTILVSNISQGILPFFNMRPACWFQLHLWHCTVARSDVDALEIESYDHCIRSRLKKPKSRRRRRTNLRTLKQNIRFLRVVVVVAIQVWEERQRRVTDAKKSQLLTPSTTT
jgi:hypothetical protein